MTEPGYTLFSEEAINKNPELKSNGLNKTPVYIVSFTGMESRGIGAEPGGVEPPPFHECNVIVDASTGETLMSFAAK